MALTLDQLSTLEDLATRCPAIPKQTIQWWITSNKQRFRDRCVIKVDGRVFVDLAEVAGWVEEWRTPRDGREAEIVTV